MAFFMFGGRFKQSVRECFSPRHASVHRRLPSRGGSDAGKPFGARQFSRFQFKHAHSHAIPGFLHR